MSSVLIARCTANFKGIDNGMKYQASFKFGGRVNGRKVHKVVIEKIPEDIELEYGSMFMVHIDVIEIKDGLVIATMHRAKRI